MRVYNLQSYPLDFHGKVISANGGHLDLPDNTFIPSRDRNLEKNGVISFNQLPSWFLDKQAKSLAQIQKSPDMIESKPVVKKVEVVVFPEPTVDEPKVVDSDEAPSKGYHKRK